MAGADARRKAADVIGELYDRCWAGMLKRPDVTPVIRDFGQRLAGKVGDIEREEADIGRKTLIQGDASFHNARTSPDGVVAFLDWEDVRSLAGSIDLTWLLVSSVHADHWDAVIDAYAPDEAEFQAAPPRAAIQGILSFAHSAPGSPTASGWVSRIEAVAGRIG
jgi:hypothetical protein